ncbi:MAG: two-component regulator propeller domain-containing protein [Pyrinomonadaceae bacterium]
MKTGAIGSGGGVEYLENNRFVDFTRKLDLPIGNYDFREIYQTPDGAMWFATSNGLFRYQNEKVSKFTTGNGLPSNDVKKVFRAANGDFWIGTLGGLARFSGATLNTAITHAKTEILADAKANKTDLLRAQIEADLSTESNGVKVGWFMTPTANGGQLDFVQQIVTLTLANIKAAGGSVGNAQSFLDKANADKAAGNFKSAYDNYRKAYKAAVN